MFCRCPVPDSGSFLKGEVLVGMQEFLQKGNINRTQFPSATQLPLYLGSGCAGCCIDGYGLMDPFAYDSDSPHANALCYRSQGHFYRGNFGIDTFAPLYRLSFACAPRLKHNTYSQKLDLYQATVATSYELTDGTRIRLQAFFNTKYRNVFSVIYEYEGKTPDLLLAPQKTVLGWYGQRWETDYSMTDNGFVLKTNMSQTTVSVQTVSECGECIAVRQNDGLRLQFSGAKGRHLLMVSALPQQDCNAVDPCDLSSISVWQSVAQESWKAAYGDSYVMLPDDFAAAMTARSFYYIMASFSPQTGSPAGPMGWSGYGWPFHFPQDVSYIFPVLLRLGKLDLAKAVVQYYRNSLEDMRIITRRIYGGEGVMWAWIYPIGSGDDLMKQGAPNPYHFEVHNAAYPARMAYETALQLGDEAWTKEVAVPIVQASAQFYASHLTKTEQGNRSLHVVPSMSQDEHAAADQSDYLCALYSARYCFKIATELGLTQYAQYLDDGLCFSSLLDGEKGMYRTYRDMPPQAWGKELLPVQLNPLVFLPYGTVNEAERTAYLHREDICSAVKEQRYDGWTLPAFWVAACHMHDPQELYRELHRSQQLDYCGTEQISFRETSGREQSPYYITSHGLWLQAVLDAFVSDYFGGTELCSAVPPQWRGAEYHNLYTKDGKVHNGIAE